MHIRHVLGATFLGLALLASGPVLAKKDKAAAASTASSEPMVGEIELTKLDALDGTLGKAQGIETTIVNTYNNLNTARTNANTALGVSTDKPFATALGDLKSTAGDKLKFAMDGTVPSFTLADGAPDNVKAAVDATKGLISATTTAIKDMASMPDQVKSLIDEAKALPGKIPTLGLDVKSLASATKIVGKDVKAIGALPDKIKSVTDMATGIVTDIKGAFGG